MVHPNTLRARNLRRTMTDAERALWSRLKGAQLGVSFRRQHPIGLYIADFAAPSVGLIIEVDGGQHATNRKASDEARDSWLQEKGYRVMRFWNTEILENVDGVLAVILSALESRQNQT